MIQTPDRCSTFSHCLKLLKKQQQLFCFNLLYFSNIGLKLLARTTEKKTAAAKTNLQIRYDFWTSVNRRGVIQVRVKMMEGVKIFLHLNNQTSFIQINSVNETI